MELSHSGMHSVKSWRGTQHGCPAAAGTAPGRCAARPAYAAARLGNRASIDWRGAPLGCAERPAYARPAGAPGAPSRPGPRLLPCRGRVAPPATDYPRPSTPALPAGQKARPRRFVVGKLDPDHAIIENPKPGEAWVRGPSACVVLQDVPALGQSRERAWSWALRPRKERTAGSRYSSS